MRITCIFLVFALFATGLKGQDQKDSLDVPVHELGFAAGYTTGYGLSYRIWPSRIGLQGTFFYSKEGHPAKGNIPEVRSSMGLSLMYRLVEGDVTSLYLYQGNHFNFYSYPQSPPLGCPTCSFEKGVDQKLFNGIGIGVEFLIGDLIDLSLMTGYRGTTYLHRPGNVTFFKVTGEVGLYYRF